MNEELEQLLKNLRLKRILEIYEEQLQAAEKQEVSYTEFFLRLARAQWHARQETALEWRIRQANLPERWSLDTFPFARQPGVNRQQIRAFAELEFVAQGGEHRLHRPDRSREDRTRLRTPAEGARERLPLPVRPRAGPVRRDVRLARRPLEPPADQAPRAGRRTCRSMSSGTSISSPSSRTSSSS